jgi:hypothetical protein
MGERFGLRQRRIALAVLGCLFFAPSQSNSMSGPNHDSVGMELSTLGKQGDTIRRARQQVLGILLEQNACTAWFQESDENPAEVFRSLHFELERNGPTRIYGIRTSEGHQLFKHPWGARATEGAGRGASIQLNANGPFFTRSSPVVQLGSGAMVSWPSGNRMLTISSYNGDTPEAQIAILLHELGHIIGRLPEDDGSWDGRSVRNTAEVARHCRAEIGAAAHNALRSSN